MATFPERLKELRNNKNITLNDIAKAIGTTKATLSRYENGIRIPNAEVLNDLAEYFNVSLDYIAGKTDEPRPADKIKKALSDDPELLAFWDELSKREDLQLMFKQTRDLDPAAIKQIIEIIRTFEKEEEQRYN
ncbi:MAG: helix-turn-helix domain-containing protein [Firmicutes bacterium]|nr:helix-turn-helix domain-containing protein [Bacillota bacterium]